MSLQTTLASEIPIPPETHRTCWHCDSKAIAYWPANSDSPIPLCKFHLESSKTRLIIALGGQGELNMQWPTNGRK